MTPLKVFRSPLTKQSNAQIRSLRTQGKNLIIYGRTPRGQPIDREELISFLSISQRRDRRRKCHF